jgi:hypothetical protein
VSGGGKARIAAPPDVINNAMGAAAQHVRDTLSAAGISTHGMLLVVALDGGPLAIIGGGCPDGVGFLMETAPASVQAWAEGMRRAAPEVREHIIRGRREFDA